MKALVKSRAESGLWLEDVAEPKAGANDVVVRVRKTGICGTDLHIYNWDDWSKKTITVPRVIGHECMGEIASIGSHVVGYTPGERVSIEGHITCGYCRNCRAGKRHLCRNSAGVGIHRPGCFAEYVCLPASNLFRLPSDVADDIAAFLDPLGNAVHTALSYDLVGEDVLVTGAGPIGLMAAAVAKRVGARYVVITDVNAYRLEIAKKLGISRAVDVRTTALKDVMKDLGMTEGFDVGLEMSGNPPAFRDMLDHMNYGGRIALLGLSSREFAVDWDQIIFKGLIIKGIYGREMFETWYKMSSLLQSGLDVRPVLTHVLPAKDFHAAFELVGDGQCGKVVLDWV